jgi:hypothetical protein
MSKTLNFETLNVQAKLENSGWHEIHLAFNLSTTRQCMSFVKVLIYKVLLEVSPP